MTMARFVVFTAGTSIFRGLEAHGVEVPEKDYKAVINKSRVAELGDEVDGLSAELATLADLQASSQDRIRLLATDTDQGERAAGIVARFAELRYGLSDDDAVKRVGGLEFGDPVRFQSEGIPNLIEGLERVVEEAERTQLEPILAVSGGTKPMVHYAALYGMLRRLQVTYVFERPRRLVSLRPLPIDFDWDALARVEPLLEMVDRNTLVELSGAELRDRMGDDADRLGGLFVEVEEGKWSLSPLGFLVFGDFERGRATKVTLSSAARKALDKASGPVRWQMEHMLDRVRLPGWRRQHRHRFEGTDLVVFKPGNTAERMAGWVDGDVVNVAELYGDHDRYRSHLPTRSQGDYEPRDFEEYRPEVPESEAPTGDSILERAWAAVEDESTRREEAERRELEALQLLEQLSDRLKDVEARADSLADQADARARWSMLRRLEWALLER